MRDLDRSRIVLIALDAMEVSFLDELFAKGRLPNLRRFAEETKRVGVRSLGDPLHGSIWPTFASGTGPGHHGIFWWTQWLAEEMRHVRNTHEAFHYEPFWGALARKGIRTCVVDVPYAPLVQAPGVRQFLGWGIHDEVVRASWPEELGSEIQKRFGKHPLSFDTVEPQSHKDKRKMAREMRKGIAMRTRLVEWLLREDREDVVLVMFGETHKLGHYLAAPEEIAPGKSNIDIIGEALEAFDDAWPGIVAAAGPSAHIMLFALHGIHHQVDYSNPLAAQILAIANGKQPEAGVAERDLLRKVRDLLPDSVHRAIWKRLPASFRAARQGNLIEAGADYSNDALIRVGHDGYLGFRANVRGRERDGVVEPESADSVVDRVWELARHYSVPDGRAAFTGLWRPGEETPGPRAHRLPDALLKANLQIERTDRLIGPDGTVLHASMPEARNGIHTGRGFCYFRPAAGSTATPARDEWDVMDFAPTIFELTGVPVPQEFQGRSGIA